MIIKIEISKLQLFFHSSINILAATSLTTQSIPSNNPSPVFALHGIIPQCLDLISPKHNTSLISSSFNDPLISYLLQNINNVLPDNFSYFSNECNSSLQDAKRNLSVESTTHIKASVYSK